jgi:CBS domain-containing protein
MANGEKMSGAETGADGSNQAQQPVRRVSIDEGRVEFAPTPVLEQPAGVVSRTEIPLQEPACAGEVMTENVATAAPDADLVSVAAIMRDQNVGIVPIVDDSRRILGVITDRDIVVRVDANATSAAEVKAADVMTTNPVTVRPQDDLHDVIDRMGEEGLQRVLVANEASRLVGIISVSDLAQRTDLPERVQDTLDQIGRKKRESHVDDPKRDPQRVP